MSYVYWIHDKDHIDKSKDGYVGVTENPKSRFASHIRNKRVPENAVFDIIFEGSRQECFDLEEKLRPTKGIGWNSAKGGSHGWRYGFYHSDKTREKLRLKWTDERKIAASSPRPEHSAKLKGRTRPDHSNAMKGSGNPMFGTSRPEHVRKAVSEARRGKPPANKIEFYCILCHQRVSPTILRKSHGIGKKHCIK